MSRIIDQTTSLSKQLRGGQYTHDVAAATVPGQTTASYPRGGLGADDPRDDFMRAKVDLIAANGGTGRTPFGEVQATDADFRWMEKKRDSEAAANFDGWLGKNFHTADVVQRKWLQDLAPEYYESREQQMVDKAKLALRINLLLLRGPKSQKDLILQWGLETGAIEMDADWNKIGPHINAGDWKASDTAAMQARFAKGLFNPTRYTTDVDRGINAGVPHNPFMVRGATGASLPRNFSAAGNVTTPGRFNRHLVALAPQM